MAKQKYYVIESHDLNTPAAHQTFGIYSRPGCTNMSSEERVVGWLGTTNNVHEYAHGEFETLAAAQKFIQAKMPGAEILNAQVDYYESTVVENYGFNEIWTTGDFFGNNSDSELEIEAGTTNEEIENLAEEFESEAGENGIHFEDDVNEYLRERRDALREEK